MDGQIIYEGIMYGLFSGSLTWILSDAIVALIDYDMKKTFKEIDHDYSGQGVLGPCTYCVKKKYLE